VSVKEVSARKLAQAQFFYEPGIQRIFEIDGNTDVEARRGGKIKLLIINENTIPGGVIPLGFGPLPDRGIPYPYVIVEITPEEFELVKEGTLRLPDGWEIGEELPREPNASDEMAEMGSRWPDTHSAGRPNDVG
jgi:hypothetical protein